MKLRIEVAVCSSVLMLTGCETMFYHITLDDTSVVNLAMVNATVNHCGALNLLDKNVAYAFGSVSAQMLAITVVNKDLFKARYEQQTRTLQDSISSGQRQDSDCAEVEKNLPAFTQRLYAEYVSVSQRLAAGRAIERQQMANMLANFGRVQTQPTYATTYGWPSVEYVDYKPASANYLVNTSKGLIQCRVTSKNYVFCM